MFKFRTEDTDKRTKKVYGLLKKITNCVINHVSKHSSNTKQTEHFTAKLPINRSLTLIYTQKTNETPTPMRFNVITCPHTWLLLTFIFPVK